MMPLGNRAEVKVYGNLDAGYILTFFCTDPPCENCHQLTALIELPPCHVTGDDSGLAMAATLDTKDTETIREYHQLSSS
jgi:hypothetical protein